MINFNATPVFQETWRAINERTIDEKGNDRRKYRIIEQVGSSRSSKTWSDLQCIFLYGYENRYKRIFVLRDVAKDCREMVESEFKTWLRDPFKRVDQAEKGIISYSDLDRLLKKESLTSHLEHNKTNHTWTFKKSASVITFTGADDEDRIIGLTPDVFWVNEPYKFQEEPFKQILQRTSDFAIVDWNPKQNHFIESMRKRDDFISLHSTFLMNPFCPSDVKKGLLAYQSAKFASFVLDGTMNEEQVFLYDHNENPLCLSEKKIKELLRIRDNHRQGTASDWHWQVYGLGTKAEKPNRIYRGWKKISIDEYNDLPDGYNRYFGLDFGTTNPTAIVEIKTDSERNVFVKPVLYEPISEMPNGISEYFEKLGIEKKDVVVVDPADKGNRTTLLNNGYQVLLAKKEPGSVEDGINILNSLNVYYVSDSEFENEYENYEWEIVNGVNLERPLKKDDHYMDALRYVVRWLVSTGRLVMK